MTGDLEREVAALPYWFHSIDLGGGVVTPGEKPAAQLEDEWRALALPDLRGKTVLDVGAWDGYFSFRAEEAGAARVVALDHYVWSIDREAAQPAGNARPVEDVPGVWRPDTLPGKRAFDLARRARRSRVEDVVADFTTADLEQLGTFDVVLFLGVLYHLRHPLAALERLRRVTRALAVVETEAVVVRGQERAPLCLFLEGTDEEWGDPTNWWVPTAEAAAALCRAAGFSDARVVWPTATPRVPGRLARQPPLLRYRATIHAYA